MESIRSNSNGNGRDNCGFLNKGDFEQIYTGNSRRMFAIAYNILRNVGDAEHAVQESFLQLSKHYSEFRGESKISTYLHRVVVNESLMTLRRKERRIQETSLEQECEDGSLISRTPAMDCRSQYINRINIERAVNHLPDGQRKIWILYDYLGCKHWEIAKALGCSLGNAKSQLNKAREKLRRALNSQQKLAEKQKNNNNHDYNLHDEAMSLQQALLLKQPGLAPYSIL